MSTNRTRSTGGLPARRAMVRWAGRLFRRDWRQHVLILVLLTVAVAIAIGFSCASFNLAPAPGRAEFGDATHYFTFDQPDPATLPGKLDAARAWFGEIDAIGHRPVAVPGSLDELDYRAQDPHGPFGASLLALRAGRYPAAATDVAVTAGALSDLDLDIGSTLALDGVERTVVGIVENPNDLRSQFVLLPAAELATSDSVRMLVDAGEDRVLSFRPPGDSHRDISARGEVPEDVLAAILTLVVSTLVMVLIALTAAASFTVIAQRRLPQLGMLSAVGATEKHIRLTMVASGAVTGLVASVLGAVIGLAGWIVAAPRMESAVGARIDVANVPWWIVGSGMLLAITAATAAAWWPGRAMSRIPTVLALSGRPPKPTPLHRSALVAGGLLIGGVVFLRLGSGAENGASATELAFILVGTLAVVGGVLVLSPLAVSALGRTARLLPVGPRLAVRDLSRYQARSGAALAAISFALGIPVALAAATAAAENNVGAGNLESTQLMVLPGTADGPFIPTPDEIEVSRAGVDLLSGSLPEANVLSLDVARDPDQPAERGLPGVPAISMARRLPDGWADLGLVYVASPALLAEYGLEPSDLGHDILTTATGDLQVLGERQTRGTEREGGETVAPGTLTSPHDALPGSIIAAGALAERGWTATPSGRWLIETPQPLTSAELGMARDIAARYGFTVEHRDDQESLASLRLGSVGVGMLLALGVLAMTVGLIRSEAARDLRTLTATGATSATRRTVTAVTAGGLAALGAVLGITGAYVGLAAGRLSNLTPVPLFDLLAVAIGLPLLAAGVGWLLSGREPDLLTRGAIG